jgi:hypothetical protein
LPVEVSAESGLKMNKHCTKNGIASVVGGDEFDSEPANFLKDPDHHVLRKKGALESKAQADAPIPEWLFFGKFSELRMEPIGHEGGSHFERRPRSNAGSRAAAEK